MTDEMRAIEKAICEVANVSDIGVIVRGMGMPKSCFGCHLFNLDDQDLWCIANHYAGCCRVLSKYIDENKFVKERHPDCPLVEVPPHGDLVDRTELLTEYDRQHKGPAGGARRIMEQAKTVIEAEGEDNA